MRTWTLWIRRSSTAGCSRRTMQSGSTRPEVRWTTRTRTSTRTTPAERCETTRTIAPRAGEGIRTGIVARVLVASPDPGVSCVLAASLTKFIELADAKLDDYLQRLDQSDASESKTAGSRVKNLAEKIAAIRDRRTRCKDMLAQLDRTGEDQISLTDPDSRAMAAHTHVAVGYNVQVAVDTKHKLIVEQQVTNQVVDMGLLTQTAEPAKEILGVETIEVVADKGYFKIEDIETYEKAGMVPYVPRPQCGPSVKAGLFRKDEFQYDATTDSYVCPAGQRLHPYSSSLLRGLKKIN
jgi:hypothetical protein